MQWVPHGFGYRSMNLGFCLWLRPRARSGDQVELMVHEPYLEFSWRCSVSTDGDGRGAPPHVDRRARRGVAGLDRDSGVGARLRPYALGRPVTIGGCRFRTLFPCRCPTHGAMSTGRVRRGEGNLVGHLSGYGPAVAKTLLNPSGFDGISPHTDVLLMGRRSETSRG